jgi:quercetin dioxygenase-like cupin family protein
MAKKAMVVRKGDSEMLAVMGAQVTFLCGAAKTEKSWSLMECTVPKDSGPPPHDHPWDEAYYIVAGEVRFTVGDQTVLVGPGDFLYAPGGTVHAFQGVADSSRVLVFDAPAAAEAFFREVDRVVKEPADLAKVPEIGERHHIRFAAH